MRLDNTFLTLSRHKIKKCKMGRNAKKKKKPKENNCKKWRRIEEEPKKKKEKKINRKELQNEEKW